MPKTIYLNYRCLPTKQAKKLPIRINHNIKIGSLDKKCIIIHSDKIERSMILLGFRGGRFISENKSFLSVSNGGKLVFGGACCIAEGTNIYADGGTVSFGNNFYANRNLQIECYKDISFGNDVLMGWNISIRDSDGHTIRLNGTARPSAGRITIGRHVWVASDVTILKNSAIRPGCAVGCNSTVCGKYYPENCLIAGSPAAVVRENIEWEE